MYAPHDALAPALQVPAPSQVPSDVWVEPLHVSPAQTVPCVQRRQAPAPLHWPSSPQVETASCAHSLSGSVPPMIGPQTPSAWAVLAFEQAAQLPLQAVLQQTPSTQEPVVHSPLPEQAAPCALIGTHTVPAQ
jgi:hypothetical protein